MTTIIFTSKERRMLKTMCKKSSEATLASQIQVTVTTIRRWMAGLNVPPYSTRIMISKMYDEYKDKK